MVARHPRRPYTLDYLSTIFTDFIELHGDRLFRDDPAIVGGWARLGGQSVMVIGHQKGRDTKDNLRRNFGMPHPEGYRKALRLMQLAARFGAPVITLIDTDGAYPGLGRRGARAVRGAGAQHPGDVRPADAHRGHRDRRRRIGRRAGARRRRPGADVRELDLLGHFPRGVRGHPLEGRLPARARGGGAQAHGRRPPPAQGDRRDHPRTRPAAPTPTPTPPARRCATRCCGTSASCGRSSPTNWSAVAPRSTAPWAPTPRPDAADRRSPVQGEPEGALRLGGRGPAAAHARRGHRRGRPRPGPRPGQRRRRDRRSRSAARAAAAARRARRRPATAPPVLRVATREEVSTARGAPPLRGRRPPRDHRARTLAQPRR